MFRASLPSPLRLGGWGSDRRNAPACGEHQYTVTPASSVPHVEARIRAHLRGGAEASLECAERAAGEIAAAAAMILEAARAGGRILLFGNGGSAADAQHLAADLVGRFLRERRPIPAVALSTDTSVLTALGNDYGFDQIFARQVQALVRPGDVVVAISTSGRSANVVAGAQAARTAGARVVALTGRDGGPLAREADVAIRVPADHVAHVQEAHIAVGHAICAVVEEAWT
jgi:D-sedoheptulose 7-phosphate isomerase